MDRDFSVVLYDRNGTQINEWDVSLETPKRIGWNLSMQMGCDGLCKDIVKAIKEADAM